MMRQNSFKDTYLLATIAVAIILVGVLHAGKKGGKIESAPNPPIPKKKLVELTGENKEVQLSRDVGILWLYGPEDHKGGEHDYIRIKELFV